MKNYLILFFIFQLYLFASVDAYEKNINNLLKKHDYKSLAKILDKEVNHLNEYKHSYIWAQMYEGGFGVKKDIKKAIDFYKKDVNWYKHGVSADRLGYYYGAKKQYKKAAYWWRIGATLGSKISMGSYGSLNILKKEDSDFFNTLVGYKWLKLASNKGYKKAKDLLLESPNLKDDVALFAKMRQYHIDKTPFEKKLAGIILGEKFNQELLLPTKRRKPSVRINISSINQYKNVSHIYADKTSKYIKNLKYINVRTSLNSNTVYRVVGKYYFKTKKECIEFKDYYFRKLRKKSSKQISSIKQVNLKNIVTYADIGVPHSVSRKDWPYGLKNIYNLKGIRHLVEYYPGKKHGFYVEVSVIDFKAMKLKIAEAIKYDTFFKYIGKDYQDDYAFMHHFGLTLLKKIPKNILRKKLKSTSRKVNQYEFKTPYPYRFFQSYKVSTSLLTNTILDIKAEGIFNNNMDAFHAKKGIKKSIFKKYNLNPTCLSFSSFVISARDGVDCLSEKLGKKDINILINYEKYNTQYKLYFKAYSKYAKKLKDREYWLLNY